MSVASFALIALAATAAVKAPCSSTFTSAADQAQVGSLLQTYCRACHGIGTLRFIYSDDPVAVWQTVTQQTVPGSTQLWKDDIVQALSWPSATPPDQDAERSPGHSWMPRGEKRLEIVQDRIGDEDARQLILRVLGSASPARCGAE